MMKNIVESLTLTANSPKISGEGSSQNSINHPFSPKALRFCAMLLLLCLSVGQMWGDGDIQFLAKESDDVYIKYIKNGGDATQQNISFDGQTDIEVGTVSSLVISEFRANTKKHDATICGVYMVYGINSTKNGIKGSSVMASHNTSGYDDWSWDSWWGCEQYLNTSVNIDLLNEKAPGNYWFDFYFSITGDKQNKGACNSNQAYWSNNGGNYHLGYTIPSKNLTVSTNANGTASGSQTGVKKGHAYTITATPDENYAFAGWATSDSHITIANPNSATTTVTFDDLSGNATITANFAPQWTIKGTMSDDGWNTFYNLPYSTANTFVGEITLDAHKTYRFKVYDRRNSRWYGYGVEQKNDPYVKPTYYTFVGQSETVEIESSGTNLRIMTAEAGTYIFTYNSSTNVLSVTYPDVTHPSSDYIYFKDNSYEKTTAHIFGGVTESTAWGNLPILDNFTFDGETYYYAALGDNSSILFADGDNAPTTTTSDLDDADDNLGKYYDLSTTSWNLFDVTITLDKNGGSGATVPTSIKATYNSSSLTSPYPAETAITNNPWKKGRKFMGWYSGSGGSGELVINASGALERNVTVSGVKWTDGSGNWIYDNSVTLYAQWVERWTIAGSWDSFNEDTYPMGSITTTASGDDSCSVTITTLSANTSYTFRVINRGYDATYSYIINRLNASADNIFYGTASKTKTVGSGDGYTYDIGFTTAGAGDYIFSFNIKKCKVTVTYPTSYTVTFGYGTGGSAVTATVEDATTITSGQYAAEGKDITFTQTPATGYTFKGWYTTGDGNTEVTSMAIDDNVLEDIAADATVYAQYTEDHYNVTAAYGTGGSAATPSSATSMGQITGGDITATAATGYTFSTWSVTSGSGSFGSATTASTKFYPTSASTVTASFTANGYTVTLNDDGGSDGSGSKSVTYNASTNLTSNVAVPTKSGYTFGGYYTSQSGAGSQLVDENGAWIKSVASYTGASGDNPTWIYAGNLTVYAKWTQTVALDTEGGSGSTDVVVTYNSATLGSMTNPTKTGYTFGGYYTGDDGTDELVISTSQVLQASVTADEVNYTGAGGIWVYDGDAPTLYAKWTVKTYTVTLNKNGGTGSTPASVTATYGSGSLSASIPKPTKAGYYIAGWYTDDDKLIINADGALVSGISGYTDGAGNWIHDDDVILYAKWVLTWTLAGNKWNNWAKEDHIFDGVGTNASSKDTCYVDIDLDANTDYNFKIIKRDVGSTYWWHALAAWQNITYVTSKTTTTFTGQSGEDKGYSCTLSSAGAGTYRFILNLTDMTVTVVYPESYYVTMAMNPSINSSTISPESGYMSKDNGATITATPDYSHYFNGWTSSSGGTFDNASSAETTFKPTATTTVTAALPERTAFLQGRFQVRNSSGAPIKTKADGGWENNSTTIKMDYDAENNRYFLHTYSTPAELMEQIDSNDPMFYIKTSTSTSSITDGASYAPASDADNSLDNAGEEVAVQKNNTRGTFLKGSVEANAILYFDGSKVWYELEQNTFTDASGDHKWSTASNWSADSVPGITDMVYINKPVTVDIDHAKAKRIILDQNDKTGKLTIQANKGLEVLQTIKRTTDGSNRLATRAEDLILESSSSGNASLIFDNNNSDAATVQMYSKASISGDTWNWQFMGTPFTSANALYSYYGSYLYEWNSSGDWDVVPNGGTMTPFTGYCITQSSATTYVMDGTLNPNSNVNISIPENKEFVMANSWTAPISVHNFTSTTLPLDDKTIYLFNTGFAPEESGDAKQGTAAGTYIAMPISSAIYTGNYLIAPMEGFYVDNRGHDAATITLKYNELVRPQVSRDIIAGAMHAPKRVAAEAEPDVMKIKATGSRYSERIVILAREDFSADFDNGWDGKNINEPGVAPILYALREDGTKDAVSAIPSFEGTVVGFRQGEDNQYTFSFDYDGEDIWYLNDLKEEKCTLIDAANTYSFVAEVGDAEARFIISATPIQKLPTGIGNDANDGMTKVRKLIINDQLFIIRAGRMYNAVGSIVK